MSELSWKNVHDGDSVKVKHEEGAIIEGIYGGEGHRTDIVISGLFYNRSYLELLEHTPSFKNGDIGVITSHYTGNNFVGIYNDGAFWSSDSNTRTKIHSLAYGEGHITKIVGNVYEQ